jgi:hypothetical protein
MQKRTLYFYSISETFLHCMVHCIYLLGEEANFYVPLFLKLVALYEKQEKIEVS